MPGKLSQALERILKVAIDRFVRHHPIGRMLMVRAGICALHRSIRTDGGCPVVQFNDLSREPGRV